MSAGDTIWNTGRAMFRLFTDEHSVVDGFSPEAEANARDIAEEFGGLVTREVDRLIAEGDPERLQECLQTLAGRFPELESRLQAELQALTNKRSKESEPKPDEFTGITIDVEGIEL